MKVLFATSNIHKVLEGNEIGRKFGIEFKQISVAYPEIRNKDVARVAENGARFAFNKIKKPLIVEDTGLFIDALNGFPGSFSAFVFRKIGNNGILRLMKNIGNRKAKFISAIAYFDLNGVKIFKGLLKGTIAKNPKGTEGFGYDPIFIPEKSRRTLAENFNLKNKISHRKKAFEKFCRWYKNRSYP